VNNLAFDYAENGIIRVCVQVAFGDAWGFAFIWTKFFVNHNGGLAIIAITFSRYIVAGVSEEALIPFG
jgi:hypothetical protein